MQSSALSQEVVSLQTERGKGDNPDIATVIKRRVSAAESLIQRVSTERAQLAQSSEVAIETHQQERDQLNRQLQQQVSTDSVAILVTTV